MFGVDQCSKTDLGILVKLPARFFTTGILCGGDDLEILFLQFFVNLLPPGQILSASSPGSPSEQQHFLAAKIRKTHQFSITIG